MVFASGMGAIASTMLSLLSAGDEVVCSAAIYGGTLHLLQSFLARFGVTTRFVDLDQLRDPTFVIGPATKVVWFESPINPTLRCLDIARVAGGVPCRRCPLGDGQHLRDALQPASADARRRPGHAQRHQVPQRAQRRHRGSDHGIARARRAARAGPQADWRAAGPGRGRARGARAEDAGRAHGAPQRQRAGTGARLRGRPAHDARCCIRAWPATPITRSRRRRCAASAAW